MPDNQNNKLKKRKPGPDYFYGQPIDPGPNAYNDQRLPEENFQYMDREAKRVASDTTPNQSGPLYQMAVEIEARDKAQALASAKKKKKTPFFGE